MPPDEVAFLAPQEEKYNILYNAFKGKMENGYAFAGSNAWRSDRIMSVKELITSLKDEFDAKIKSFM
jgi:hypothetical protein